MSKIQKESNSQPSFSSCDREGSCCDICQRYKKKAIHNDVQDALGVPAAVAIYVKDTKRKQFTTPSGRHPQPWSLLRYMSKMQKESNSQRTSRLRPSKAGCCDICQRYKKKAIHNALPITMETLRLLRYMSKIQKESNSQHYLCHTSSSHCCCDICQRYKKKAIHNQLRPWMIDNLAVAIYVKDTKRKQFTTRFRDWLRFAPSLPNFLKLRQVGQSSIKLASSDSFCRSCGRSLWHPGRARLSNRRQSKTQCRGLSGTMARTSPFSKWPGVRSS